MVRGRPMAKFVGENENCVAVVIHRSIQQRNELGKKAEHEKEKEEQSSNSDDNVSSGEDSSDDENSSKKVHALQKDMIRMMEF